MANQIYTSNANEGLASVRWAQRGLLLLLVPLISAVLSACGGSGVSGGASSGGSGGGGTPPAAPPTLTLTLTDPTTNAAVTTIAPGTPAKVSATFKSATNVPVAGAVAGMCSG